MATLADSYCSAHLLQYKQTPHKSTRASKFTVCTYILKIPFIFNFTKGPVSIQLPFLSGGYWNSAIAKNAYHSTTSNHYPKPRCIQYYSNIQYKVQHLKWTRRKLNRLNVPPGTFLNLFLIAFSRCSAYRIVLHRMSYVRPRSEPIKYNSQFFSTKNSWYYFNSHKTQKEQKVWGTISLFLREM